MDIRSRRTHSFQPRVIYALFSHAALILALTSCTAKPDNSASASDTARAGPRQEVAASQADSAISNTISNPIDADIDSAVDVVRRYYSEINSRDFAAAYREWGDNGPPGNKTPEAFAAGFDSTTSVKLTIDSVGRIEGAAGSRYLTVGVTIKATDRANRESVFTGNYVIRKSVVDGATDTQRRWHIYSATLSSKHRY
jgi:hypothetical protein